MPYYTRPDGTREIELPSGRRIVTMMTPEELQARGIQPAQMSGGETPMSMQPSGPKTIRMRGPSDAELGRQLDAIQSPQFSRGPAPAVADVQRQLDERRGVPTARFADYEPPQEKNPEGGKGPGKERIAARIKELEAELEKLRGQLRQET